MSRVRVIVVGAGLSGLASAFDLLRGGAEVSVLEAAERAGGVVGTIERDGFLFETGPNAVPATAEAFRRLCGDLRIAERLIGTRPASDERFLFLRGRLRPIPRSPVAFLLSPMLTLRGRLRAASEPLRRWTPPPPGPTEPTMEAFLTERIGPEAARILAGAFVRGVYAAELAELGARSAFPRLWNACSEHGGLVRGLLAARKRTSPELPGPRASRTALLSFPRGLQELVDALARELGDRLRTRTEVEALERDGPSWRVRARGGISAVADRVVLAVPAPIAAKLLAPLDSLRGVRHADVTVVHLGLRAAAVPNLPAGFGYLVPPGVDGAPRALGTIFASNLFPGRAPEGCVAVSSFYASADVGRADGPELAAIAGEDLARALGEPRRPEVVAFDVRRWKEGIPRYEPGHAARMDEIEASARRELPGLHLAGSYLAGVSVDQVIARGRAVAREILP